MALKNKMTAAALAVLGALFYIVSMPPIGWWWAGPLGLCLLFKSGVKNFWSWLLVGLCLHLVLYSWLTKVSILGWIGLSLFADCFWIIPFYLYPKWPSRIGIAALWITLEGLRAWIGWGWLPLAASMVGCPVILNWARLGGEALTGFLIVFAVLAVVKAIESSNPKQKIIRAREFFLFLILMMLGGVTLGRLPVEKKEIVRFGLVQPNSPTKELYTDSDYAKEAADLRRLSDSLKDQRPDAIFWPEEAPAWSPANDDTQLRAWLESGARSLGAPIVSGLLWHATDRSDDYYNAVGVVDPKTGLNPQAYRKRRLVPFGEYIPFSRWKWARSLTPIVASFAAGEHGVCLPVKTGGTIIHLWPLVCYEDIFDFLSDEEEKQADVIGVFINDGWFGNGATQQHAAHSVLRAMEQGIPVVRISNNGLSGVVMPDGSYRYLDENREIGKVMAVRLEKIDTPFSHAGSRWRWGILACGIVAFGFARKNKRIGIK